MGLPFLTTSVFYTEMVKSDTLMEKVKDRLLVLLLGIDPEGRQDKEVERGRKDLIKTENIGNSGIPGLDLEAGKV
ncbi:unnamed protein product [Ilex paraguariensis]|uniref:Uncharacterized protein n=1 Tax=Ilex paraguariensis TaxID=185542 RepID=A0ABC8ULQ9_9AQUA